jgi:uncharacterized protein YaiE (UPF0345 family)
MKRLEQIRYVDYYNLVSSDKASEYTWQSKNNRHFTNPVETIGLGKFTKMTFGAVKDAQYTFSNGFHFMTVIEYIADFLEKDPKEIVTFDFKEICNIKAFIEKELEDIDKMEEQLRYAASVNDENAGMNDLSVFGVAIQIDALALGMVWEWDTVRAEPYMRCFTKLLMDKRIKEYEIASNKLK